MTHVAIIGGGVAGLSLAFAVQRRSTAARPVAVTVLEAAPRAGGNLRSERVDGFLCEWGPNGFLDNAPDTLALVHDVGLDDRRLPSREAARRRFLYHHDRLHQVPEGPISFFTSPLLSWRGRLRVAAEPFAPARPAGDETIHAFAARRIGREAADVLIDAMVSGVFGGDARELSLRACFPRMFDMETQYGGLVRALLARRRSRAASAPVGAPLGRLTSFVGGIEELVVALTARLGASVQTSARVTGIEPVLTVPGAAPSGPRWRVHVDGQPPMGADHVVCAGSAASTSRLVASLDPQLSAALTGISTAPLAVVCLGYQASTFGHPLDGFGFLVPRGEGLRLLGALWDSSIYPGRAPDGRVLIRVMLGGATDPGAVALDDDELLHEARTGLRTAMGVEVRPVFWRIIRHPVGIPQYTRGHLERLSRIDAALARHPGLWTAGNSYRGVAINACVAEAAPLADRILAADAGTR